MRRVLAVLFLASSMAACSQTPTSPSPSSAAAAVSPALPGGWVLGTQATGAANVDWSCFSQPAGCGAAVIGAAVADTVDSPTGFTATVSGSTVILTWNAPSTGTVQSYVIEAGSGSGLSNITTFDTGSAATTLTVSNVPAGSYHVRVRRRNADGLSGPSSDVVVNVGNTPAPGCPPAAPMGLGGSASGSTVTLAWNSVAGAIGYIVEAGSASGLSNLANFDTGTAATSLNATAPNGTYYIRVRTRSSCGTSGVSNEVVVTVGGNGSVNVAGRWTGTMTADGDIINCPTTFAVDLQLTQNGGSVGGTATTRTTSVRYASCSDVLGFVAQYGVGGTVAADGSISMSFGNSGAHSLTGTVSGSRMTGRYSGQNGRGRFDFTRP